MTPPRAGAPSVQSRTPNPGGLVHQGGQCAPPTRRSEIHVLLVDFRCWRSFSTRVGVHEISPWHLLVSSHACPDCNLKIGGCLRAKCAIAPESIRSTHATAFLTSILPVTAAVMRAVRYSRTRSTASSTLAINASILAVSLSRKSAIAICSGRGGTAVVVG